jgi:putative transcriptional regulator
MKQLPSLEHHFLIAMPSLNGSWFEKSVIYIMEDNDHGTTGFVINSPQNFQVQDLLDHFNFSHPDNASYLEQSILHGGPVDVEQGFIFHKPEGQWKSSVALPDGLTMTFSDDFVEALSKNQAPNNFLICLGFSGWKPNQLAQEIQSNSWLTIPYNESLLFDTPVDKKWQVALETLGVSPEFLTLEAGHA